MAKHYRLSVHDLNGNKLCDLYDSHVEQIGAARSIKITKEIEGWKETEFSLSKWDAEGNKNFRFNYIRNENLLYVYEDGELDVYCIKVPSGTHDPNKVQVSVTCNHLSEELKTKNLFKYFDDENGIDTCENLILKAIAGSGWTLIACDKFLEADGETEKIRSYSCDTKTGAWNMISGICDLFKAHPIFHGADRTIEIRANDYSTGWKEILYGKNADKIVRTLDSSNVATRLYVEGEYGDFGYVGIDNVNPTGLPFILNFDYYKELGVFTEEHQAIVDKYLSDYKNNSSTITDKTTEYLKATASLSKLIGNCGYVYVPVVGGELDKASSIYGNGATEAESFLKKEDKIAIVSADGSYTYGEYSSGDTYDGATCVIKFIPTITGSMAAHEDLITSSSDSIENYLEDLNEFFSDEGYATVTVSKLHTVYGTDNLSIVKNESFDTSGLPLQYVLNTTLEYVVSIGTSENKKEEATATLKTEMLQLIDLMHQIEQISSEIDSEVDRQSEIENEFCIKMGTMLRDGYWSDSNYTLGQEESLYQDALEMSAVVARPTVTYNIATHNLSVLPEYEGECFELANTVRIYDTDLEINDYAIVSKTVEHPDKPTSDTAALKTDLLDIGTKTLSTMLERVTELAEQVRQNRDIYRRAVAISKDGTINSDILNGAIDVLKTKLLSTTSNWTTDDKGNIIFTALDGSSAMMLCGSGFMIANSKKENGDWNWRTFGTGEGFTADLIIAGFIDAERIRARSITVDHLASNVGESLDLFSNESVKIMVENASFQITDEEIVAIVRDSDEYKSDLSELEMTSEKFEAMVKDSESVAQIEAQAGKIELVVEGEDDQGKLVLTEEVLRAIVDQIDLSANTSIKLMVGQNATIYRGEEAPLEGKKFDLWVQPSTGYIYQKASGSAVFPELMVDGDGNLYYRYNDGQIAYDLYMDENGNLHIEDGTPFPATISEDGSLLMWERVKDKDLTQVELLLEDDRIVAVVRESAAYKDDAVAIENQITETTSTLEQRADEFEVSISKLTANDEELRTYVRYKDGILELGRSQSRYTTQTSDNGFVVLQDGVPMTSMEQNTISAPVIRARRMYAIGEHSIYAGSTGHLIFN